MLSFRIVLSDVFYLNDLKRPVIGLQRGEWVDATGYVGQLGFSDPEPSYDWKRDETFHEGYLVTECDGTEWGYIAAPMSCLSENTYRSHTNLWIVADPDVRSKTLTLMEVSEDAMGERVEIRITTLAKILALTVKKLRPLLKTIVVSRDGESWFDPLEESEHYHRSCQD